MRRRGQSIAEIPKDIRDLYKTAWEISQVRLRAGAGWAPLTPEHADDVCCRAFLWLRAGPAQRRCLDMAVDRAPFIDQSQSLNVFISNPNTAKLSSMHFHAWRNGLKTGMYYLRTRAAADAIKFTVDPTSLNQPVAAKPKPVEAKPADSTPGAPDTSNMTEEELAAAKLICSRENPEGCIMCSG